MSQKWISRICYNDLFKEKGLNAKSKRPGILIYLVVLCFFFRAQSFRISGLTCISRKTQTLNFTSVLSLFLYIFLWCFYVKTIFFSSFTWKYLFKVGNRNIRKISVVTEMTLFLFVLFSES